MKCEICHKHDAQTVWFRTAENGRQEELYVCHACAERERVFGQERGIQVATMEEPDMPPLSPEALGVPREMMGRGMQEAFEQLSEKLQEMGLTPAVLGSGETCKHCGMPLDEIRMASRIGCPKCLEQFRETIESMIEEAQGSIIYTGTPPNTSEKQQALQRLRQERQTHIDNEDYYAAKLCDEAIKALEASLEKGEEDEEGGESHA